MLLNMLSPSRKSSTSAKIIQPRPPRRGLADPGAVSTGGGGGTLGGGAEATGGCGIIGGGVEVESSIPGQISLPNADRQADWGRAFGEAPLSRRQQIGP